jgi:hypothetical protein
MEKRYQVFISSTFRDLRDERQAVLRSVLELDHMPAGMELFPAADASAWDLIKEVIDNSDYYVLVMGGRYGSMDETGLGYTEREYDYASQKRKPVIALLHQNPDNLPREKTETEEAIWKKLSAFREKVEKHHHCNYWNSADELKVRAIIALTAAMKRSPAVGWVRADQVPTDAEVRQALELRNRVAELEQQLATGSTQPPAGTEDLQQGEDRFEIDAEFTARNPNDWEDSDQYTGSIAPTWNEVFASVAPSLINEASDEDLRSAFRSFFKEIIKDTHGNTKKFKSKELTNFEFREAQLDTCIVQLRALGLIRENQKQRSVRDTETYWTLTKYGDFRMTQLRALRREPSAASTQSATVSPKPEKDEG